MKAKAQAKTKNRNDPGEYIDKTLALCYHVKVKDRDIPPLSDSPTPPDMAEFETTEHWQELLGTYDDLLSTEPEVLHLPARTYPPSDKTVDVVVAPRVQFISSGNVEIVPMSELMGTVRDEDSKQIGSTYEILQKLIHEAGSYDELTMVAERLADPRFTERRAQEFNDQRFLYRFASPDVHLQPTTNSKDLVKGALSYLKRSFYTAAIHIFEQQHETDAVMADTQLVGFIQTVDKINPSIVLGLETACRTMIVSEKEDETVLALTLLETLERGDLATRAIDKHPVFSSASVVVSDTRVAAILQAKLAREQATAGSTKHEKAYRDEARYIVQLLLQKMAQDPDRHRENVNAIRQRVFPDVRRRDSMSRSNLLQLATGVSTKLDGDSAEVFRDEQSGVVEHSLRCVLRLTRSTDKEIAAQQELDDELYCQVIGMLLEQRAA